MYTVIERILYIIYLIEWKMSHSGKGFKGCAPVCFEEWCNCELKEMKTNPLLYNKLWYYPLVEYLRKKESIGL